MRIPIRLAALRLHFLIGLGVTTFATAGLFPIAPLAAQETGTLNVTVRKPDSTPLQGAFIRSDRIGGITDASGLATVVLPARLVTIMVSHPGYRPREFAITILPNVSQRHELALETRPADAASATIQTTGGVRVAGNEPLPIMVLGADDLEAGSLRHPSDIGQIFLGVPGIRSQLQSGPLEATRFRADGIRGQYTGLLVDGLPMLGGYPGAYAPMQLSPLEFEQVEWLRGPAVALFGPSAPGGVINLIPRRPVRDQVRMSLNQNSEKGGDLSVWAARRPSASVGGSLFADFHQQRLVDADDDGWGEIPRAIRFGIRPRLYLDHPNGDGLTLTAGATTEDRTGGFLLANTGGDPYREERRTRRFDGAVTARHLIGATGLLQLQLATIFQSISHRFDDLRERDHRSTLHGQLSWHDTFGKAAVTLGVGWQRDALRQRDFIGFDYTHSVPSAFGSVTLAAADRIVVSVAGRCDAHNVHGTQCEPRGDVLVHASERLDLRFFGGLGFTAPTPLADEAETLGFHATIPIAARAERLAAGGVDLDWRLDRVRLRGAVTLSRVGSSVRLVPFVGDTANRLRLLNVAEPTRVFALDLSGDYRLTQFTVGASYAFRHGTEGVPGAAGRRPIDLTPKHEVAMNLGWVAPRNAGTAVNLDVTLVGNQTLTDNIFRSRTTTYGLVGGLVSQRSGKARLYVSAENLFDVKLKTYEPVFFDPIIGGRRTNSPWIPLRGRMISLGALVDW